jgi:dGTPase
MKDDIIMEPEIELAMKNLRTFMFENVYRNPVCKQEDGKVFYIIAGLFEHYMEHKEQLPEFNQKQIDQGVDIETAVCDYIAGMTDHYAIEKYREYYEPKFWMV